MTAAADSLTERARVATDTWLREFVIALDLCPFASPALLRGEVGIEVCPATALEAALGAIAQGAERVLDDESGPRTLLLVLPSGFTDLDDFLELVGIADLLLADLQLKDELQLVAFHPDQHFADAPLDDPAHAVTRAPFPTVHLLREDDVAEAVARHPDIDGLPARNAAKLRDRAGWRSP